MISELQDLHLLRHIEDLAQLQGPVVLAIGVFDGLHLGHRAVIDRACQIAAEQGGTPVVVTFDPHPIKVLRPDQAPRLLVNTEHKLRLLAEAGLQHVLLIRFDWDFCRMPATEFAQAMIDAANPLGGIVVGESWRFGKDRGGDLALLQELARQNQFHTTGVPPVEVEGEVVSSTRIRAMITEGNLKGAEQLLGRRFSVFGRVVEGDHRGRQLGFPTANVLVGGEQFPPDGVYATAARLDHEWLPSVTNLGWRPTVKTDQDKTRLLETHLLHGSHNLYGKEIEVRFDRWLRGEQRFESLEALQSQIQRDAAAARNVFS